MVEMYVLLVVNKKRTCNEENKSVPVVPAHLRADVLEVLNQRVRCGRQQDFLT